MARTMRVHGLLCLLLPVVFLPLCSVGHAADTARALTVTGPYGGLTPEAKSLFRWLDTLGYPDVKGRPYVRVTTGWYEDSSGRHPDYAEGFLLSEAGAPIVLLSSALARHEYRDEPQGGEEGRVSMERLDFAREMMTCLQSLRKSEKGPQDPWRRAPELLTLKGDDGLGERSRAVVLAWQCARHGLDDLARGFLREAPTLSSSADRDKLSLRHLLEGELAEVEMWRTVVAFGDPAVTRAELLRRFGAIIARFPASEYVKGTQKFGPSARDYAWLLKQMVAEDGKHAAPSATATDETRVAELIFQLRDQNGQQLSQPGACDIFLDPREDASPARQLVKLGYAAVPQLIEAIGDHRFTRSVGYWRDFTYSHHVLRVGDCAETILAEIAGRSFYERSYTNASMTKDDEAAATRKRVIAWWTEFQKKGEQQSLVDGVVSGGESSPEQATRLLAKYPQAAAAAIIQGVHAAKEPWTRADLLVLVGSLKGYEPQALLQSLLKSDPDLACRVVAAEGLFALLPAVAVAAMVEDWRKLQASRGEPDMFSGTAELVGFLAGVAGPDGVRALADHLDDRSWQMRQMVVERCREGDPFLWARWRPAGAPPMGGKVTLSAPTLAAIEELLVGRLDDTAETNESGYRDGVSYSHPRLCDLAADALRARWPDRYLFDLSAGTPARDAQIIQCKNVWRGQHGLPVLPPPQRPQVPLVPEQRLHPLLDAVLAAPTTAARAQALAALQAQGLGALQGVREALTTLGPEHAARADLDSLCRRLAFVVRVAAVAPGSLPDQTLAQRLAAMQGKPLASKDFVGLVLQFVKPHSAPARRLKLALDRPGDDTGATVTVAIAPADPGAKPDWWSVNEWGCVGKGDVLGSAGGMASEYIRSADAWEELAHALDQALAAQPETPVTVRVSVQPEAPSSP